MAKTAVSRPSYFALPSLDHSVAGITAGIVSATSLHPLDLIKTRMQVDSSAVSFIGNSIRTFRSVVQSQGYLGLYRGVTPNLAGSTASWGLYFYFYTEIKQRMRGPAGETSSAIASNLSPAQHLMASATAGALTAAFTNPLWVVKTRMCTTSKTDPGAYRGLFDGLMQIGKREGLPGLYRGIVPALFGVSHGALQFMAYEEMKKWRAKRFDGTVPDKLATWEYIVMSASSKVFATTLTYPYQVIKSRLQMSGSKFNGVVDCVAQTYQKEGFRGYYKGMVPNIVRVLPGTCVTFVVYESMMGWFTQHASHKQ